MKEACINNKNFMHLGKAKKTFIIDAYRSDIMTYAPSLPRLCPCVLIEMLLAVEIPYKAYPYQGHLQITLYHIYRKLSENIADLSFEKSWSFIGFHPI